jgi:hypothetical protein
MNKSIEAAAFDAQGCEIYRRDFDTVKDARSFIRDAMLSKDFWDRRGEVTGYWKQVDTVQLITNSDVLADWFPFR